MGQYTYRSNSGNELTLASIFLSCQYASNHSNLDSGDSRSHVACEGSYWLCASSRK
jgi:hypothetical protein